jgi:hypothetical protein
MPQDSAPALNADTPASSADLDKSDKEAQDKIDDLFKK